MDSKFKSVDDYSFLYASYSGDIKKIGAGDAQEADSKSSLCSAAPEGKVSDFEIKGDKVLFKGAEGTASYARAKEAIGEANHKSPVQDGMVTTSPYGQRNGRLHKGVDIAPNGQIEPGTAPIMSSSDGVVKEVKYDSTGYGHYVTVEHTNPATGEKYYTRYAHLGTSATDSRIPVTVGQSIRAGETIGFMGNTGSVYSSTGGNGVHLHYELLLGTVNSKGDIVPGQPVNPNLIGW